jgi:hypothetical protein
LIGTVMSFLLHQRGLFVLHASAVKIGAGAIALLGVSGAGKSSLAAALRACGCTFVTDDIAALKLDASSAELVPGYPQLKLSLEAAGELGIAPDALHVLDPLEDKRGYRLHQDYVADPLPLSRIYVLAEAAANDHVRLSDQEAFVELVRHSTPTRFAQPGNEGHFRRCVQLSRIVPLYWVNRANSLGELPEAARRLADHVLAGQ